MDNFKQHPKKKRTPRVTDGFIRRPRGKKPTTAQAKSTKLDSTARIDDFKRPEGFTPRFRSTTQSDSLPDARKTGRNPIRRKDVNLDLPEDRTKKKDKKARFAMKKGLKTTAAVMVLLAGFLVGTVFLRTSQIFDGGTSALALDCNVDHNRLEGEGDGRVNVLLLGKGGPGHDGADLTDTLIVASIDPCQKDAALLSVPRDMYVQVPGNGSMKINSVYATYKQSAIAQGQTNKEAEKAGLDAIEDTMEDVLGIPINYYAMVDFEGFRRAIDTVGGVTIDVQEQLYDQSVAWENNWDPLIAPEGVQEFNGQRALLYARSRYGSERGDFDRADRQREVIVALKDKVFSLGTFGNPVKMTQLLNDFGAHVRTNISIDDLTKMYEIIQDVDGQQVNSVSLATPPNELVTTGNVGGLSVVLPKEGLYQYEAIQAYVRNQLKDGFIRKENPRIVVLNGTKEAGLATEYKEYLESYGYTVTAIGDAPSKDYQSTVFIDTTNNDKRYTRKYLELRFDTMATGEVPGGVDTSEADFVIIIGQDEKGRN